MTESTVSEIKMSDNSNSIGNLFTSAEVVWHEYPNSVTIHRVDKEPQIMKVGDFITYEGRSETGVMVVNFWGDEHKPGPNGFIYLPWREEGRWASEQISLRGNSRCIICYPTGVRNYGQHIDWNTLQIINHLAPTHEEFQKKIESLTK
jgi:hypothetical protein